MKSFIAFDRHKIYTSLQNPDPNPDDHKLTLLIELTNELGKFGFVIDQEALLYLSESDIMNYEKDIIPVLYEIYYHKKYDPKIKQPIYLEDWKSRRKEPWINNFYLSGDVRFICESGNDLNLPITFLDKLTSYDLQKIYKSIVESINNPDIEILKYLAKLYKDEEKLNPRNQLSTLVLSLYNPEIRPTKWSDYYLIHPNRDERRLILEKLENLDLEAEVKSDLRKLLQLLHPTEYKKLFPKVYNFWINKNKEVDKNSYEKAKNLIDSGNIEGFKKRFVRLLQDAIIEKSDLDSDILLLLYSDKLKVIDLLDILDRLEIIEIGCSRVYGKKVKLSHSNHIVQLIPTIKEFIYAKIGDELKNDTLKDKKIYIDPKLKLYDVYTTKRECTKLELGICEDIEFQVKWDPKDCYFSNLNVYFWKGPGKRFKNIGSNHWPISQTKSSKTELSIKGNINIKSFKELGYKYLIFNSQTISGMLKIKTIENLEFNIISDSKNVLKIKPKLPVRNNLGGLIDLDSGEVWILNLDLSTIPTINGNIQEAIIRYILPEFRVSIYDLAKVYIQSSGAEIVEDPKLSNSIFEYLDYIKLNIV